MSRIEPIELDAAAGKAKELLDELASCQHCLVAHSKAARQLGLSDSDIGLARQGAASDPRIAAMVAYGQQAIVAPGEVTDEQIAELRAHGYTDEQIAEVPALVALQLLTGGFNLIAGIEPTPENAAILKSASA